MGLLKEVLKAIIRSRISSVRHKLAQIEPDYKVEVCLVVAWAQRQGKSASWIAGQQDKIGDRFGRRRMRLEEELEELLEKYCELDPSARVQNVLYGHPIGE